jgi:molybdopterin/thiamine biosynthesis adenylyltransferase
MNDEELLRYSRHVLLPEIDVTGQEALINARVLIVGMGGLGCPIALYLTASGVGQITISDDDLVELTNLQRQIAHFDSDLGRSKVESAQTKMQAMNRHVKVTAIEKRLDEAELTDIMKNIDLVVDATDNFASRLAINRVCVATKTPVVFGAAVRLDGQILVYDPTHDGAPCYECAYNDVNDSALNCSESGVAAPLVGIIGTCQAMEALRIICNIGESSAGYLQTFDARSMTWNRFKVLKRSDCAGCAHSR